MIRSTKIVVLMLFIALMSSACAGKQATTGGGGTPATESTTTTPSSETEAGIVDVCQWFTEADAEAVLGAPVEQKKGRGGYGLGDCTYTSGGRDLLRIEAGTVEDYESLVVKFEDAEKVSGVGQDAIWVAFFTTLDVKLNDNYFVAVIVSEGDKELAIQVGKRVAAAP